VRFELERNMIYATIDSIAEKIVVSAHDISNGGLGTTAAEMALAGKGDLGMELALDLAGSSDLSADRLVFSESSGFLLECKAGAEEELEKLLKGYDLAIMRLGKVTESPTLVMTHEGKTVVRMDLETAKKAWTGSLAEAMR
ncbi:MAG TPA: phosphoribosylformylglycinamidine synthase, partial [Methanotrichaceae archaeon]|nr:phosphoribosylformylglycinamidine synthase [Methanotrichaceae archaeon]